MDLTIRLLLILVAMVGSAVCGYCVAAATVRGPCATASQPPAPPPPQPTAPLPPTPLRPAPQSAPPAPSPSAPTQPPPEVGRGEPDRRLIHGLSGAHDLSSSSEVSAHIEQVLARSGIELIDVPVGTGFDAEVHDAQAMQPTDDPARHRTVASVIRPGWRDGTVVLREPQVCVWRYPGTDQERNPHR